MNNMGAWALKEHNINLKMLTTNQAESLNAKIKRINMNKELPLDLIVYRFYELSENYSKLIILGRYQKGNYHIRDHLREFYDPNASGVQLPSIISYDEEMKRIEQRNSQVKIIFTEFCLVFIFFNYCATFLFFFRLANKYLIHTFRREA